MILYVMHTLISITIKGIIIPLHQHYFDCSSKNLNNVNNIIKYIKIYYYIILLYIYFIMIDYVIKI